MANVIIDGTVYVPQGGAAPRIGVAITTRNRPETLTAALVEWRKFLPKDAVLVVVDDASDKPAADADFRFEVRAGIAAAKNKCMELLVVAGCEHLFLSDDDTYPTSPDWWRAYVDSPEPHLMHIFRNAVGPAIIATDAHSIAYTDPRGCFLYADRSVLDRVGGMDPIYGVWGHEHVDWSIRIHNAGLTKWRFADVHESLIFCLDSTGKNPRSVTDAERREAIKRNDAILASRMHADHYVEFRQRKDVVLTCWLTASPDSQKRKGPTPTGDAQSVSQTLRLSVKGAPLVVLSDDGHGDVPVPVLGLDLYLSRWVHYWGWLRANPQIGFAFIVDAPDVVMQREPWGEMEPGHLYVGWEPKVVDDPWMRVNHPAAVMQEFIIGNRNQLLNPTVGGDRHTVMQFCHRMIRLIEDNAAARHGKSDPNPLGLDMGPLNYVAYTYFAGRLVTGSAVTTLFKANETNDYSWWRHK